MSAGQLSAAAAASELQRLLRAAGDYAHVSVRAHGGHLLVEVTDSQGRQDTVARATMLAGGDCGLSFHSHTGRWEPLPVSGPLEVIVEGLTGPLGIYIDRSSVA